MNSAPLHSKRYHRINGIVFVVSLLVGLLGLVTPLLQAFPLPVVVTSTVGIVGLITAFASGRNFMCEGSCNAA